MIIKVLGGGCANCHKLAKNVEEALEKAQIEAKVEKVTEIQDIMKYGVMSTPALVIDEEVVISGKVPGPKKIMKFLKR